MVVASWDQAGCCLFQVVRGCVLSQLMITSGVAELCGCAFANLYVFSPTERPVSNINHPRNRTPSEIKLLSSMAFLSRESDGDM